ncbi:hypothetical protein STEG23_015045, partial [Scotinomys teguina]
MSPGLRSFGGALVEVWHSVWRLPVFLTLRPFPSHMAVGPIPEPPQVGYDKPTTINPATLLPGDDLQVLIHDHHEMKDEARCLQKPVINSVNYVTKELRPNLECRDIIAFFDHQTVFPQFLEIWIITAEK